MCWRPALPGCLFLAACLPLAGAPVPAAPPEAPGVSFTVSMPRPDTHYIHVEARYEGTVDPAVELKLPAWSPGYYVILDYARNVGRFEARDSSGRPLPWEKSAKNAWRVRTGGASPFEYRRTLRFIAHEYFHHFNVKRVRPVALGPFDYDRENYTTMLWVSEGVTVYYEDLLLVRNGFTPRAEYLERLGKGLSGYESSPGRRYQSPAESSFDSWFGYFDRSEHLRNTTVSPYDSGLVLALLLDFRIRHETGNRKSIDDVMRTLYGTFAKEKGRGFTDEEFRQVCESTAGVPLAEIFDRYVLTTDPIDYAKYLAYGGLEIEDDTAAGEGDLGADLEERDGKVFVTRVGIGSGASLSGLSVNDEVLAVDAVHGDLARLRGLLSGRKTGETVKLLVARRGTVRERSLTLGPKTGRSFRLRRVPKPTPLQSTIYESWLTGRRGGDGTARAAAVSPRRAASRPVP